MGMGDCLRCIKYLLFVFNLIFCLIGLAILAIGVWMYVKPMNEFVQSSDDAQLVKYSGVFFMVIGSIITVLGFLGCCGAIFENRCLLVLFFILLLLVFLILLTAGVILLVTRKTVIQAAEDGFTLFVKNQTISEYKNNTDLVQSQLNCCGAKNAEKDYTDQNLPIPESCKPAEGKTYVSCTKLFEEHLGQYAIKLAIAIFVTAVVALLGVIFSMMLCCAITDMA